jgi:hypothetical protein
MRRTWFEARPELLDEVRDAIAADQPDLRLLVENGRVALRGTFVLHDTEGVLDRYQIEIRFPDQYPDDLPAVEEIGGRIPRVLDRHLVGADGKACLLVPEEWFVLSENRSFIAFLNGPIKNFFLGQFLVEGGKPWPFGERSHGLQGLLESYGELIGIDDPTKVGPYLDCLRRGRIKGHWDCPCGSKRRIRDCHQEQLQLLSQRIPPKVAHSAHQRLLYAKAVQKS